MPINIEPLKGTRKAGIYIISSSSRITRQTTLKIGKSTNMKQRLNSYHICFPAGFYIYGLIIETPTDDTDLRRERTTMLERGVFKVIQDMYPQARQRGLLSGARESFKGLTSSDIKKIVNVLILQHPKIVDKEKTLMTQTPSTKGNTKPQWIARILPSDYTLSKAEKYEKGIVTKASRAFKSLETEAKKAKPRAKAKRVQPPRLKARPSEAKILRQKSLELGLY